MYSLTILGLKVWNQDVGRVVLPQKALRKNHSLLRSTFRLWQNPWWQLACRYISLISVSNFTSSFLHLQGSLGRGKSPEKKKEYREFLDSLAIHTQHFHCQSPGSIPSLETNILQAVWHSKNEKNECKIPCWLFLCQLCWNEYVGLNKTYSFYQFDFTFS